MFISIIILNICFIAIAKNVNILIDTNFMLKFLELWDKIKKYYIEFLAYLSTATNI